MSNSVSHEAAPVMTTAALRAAAPAATRRRAFGVTSLAMVSLLALAGCSTVADSWDSVFGDEPPAASASANDSSAVSTDAEAPAVAAADEPEGLRAAKAPDYAQTGTRRVPNSRFALDESPAPKAETVVAASQPVEVAQGVQATPVAAPPAPQPAPAPSAAPTPTPAYDPVAADPDATVIIGGNGDVSVDPSVTVSYMPLPSGNGIQSLSAYNPNGATVSTLVATIQFANGSAGLSAKDRQILRQVVSLQRQYGAALRVVGHASSRTPDMSWERHEDANRRISEARAQSVSRALISLGAPREMIYAGAVADSQPAYEEVMPSGEAGNRRAEIYLDY